MFAINKRRELSWKANWNRHYLLAGSGVNAENVQSELQSIKFEAHEPSEVQTFEIDIDVSIILSPCLSMLTINRVT